MKIPHKYGHYVFGVLQSGVTCAVASGITVFNSNIGDHKLIDWLTAWGLSWAIMLPVVFIFAPILRLVVNQITSG